jgi:hypothetical protein
MGMHDVGTGDNRTNSMPNAHDVVTERMSDGTQGITTKVNQTSKQRILTRDARIIAYDDAGLARIFLGIVPEFSNQPVFAISIDGEDVLTALGIS